MEEEGLSEKNVGGQTMESEPGSGQWLHFQFPSGVPEPAMRAASPGIASD